MNNNSLPRFILASQNVVHIVKSKHLISVTVSTNKKEKVKDKKKMFKVPLHTSWEISLKI